MKTIFASLILLLLASCHKPPLVTQSTPAPEHGNLNLYTDIKIIPIGSLNNNNVFDTAYVTGPKFLGQEEAYGDCNNGKCSINITFSGGQPALHFENAVGAQVENIGDIDGDGFAEILIAPSWWVGCHGYIHVYSYKNNVWKHYGYADNNVCGRDTLAEFITGIDGNTLSIEELVWDEQLEDYHEKTKAFIIQ